MIKVVRFVVIIDETINYMENKALEFYSHLFGEKKGEEYVSQNLSRAEFLKIRNDFSVEVLMTYHDDDPFSFLIIDSSRQTNEKLGAEKGINIREIVYSDPDDIKLIVNRAEEIARQRKHDFIWIRVFESDFILRNMMITLNYQQFEFKHKCDQKAVYFNKLL